MKQFWNTFKYISGWVGIPVTAIILMHTVKWSAEKIIFTSGCLAMEWKCDQAIGVQQAMSAISSGEDYTIPKPIVVKKNKES